MCGGVYRESSNLGISFEKKGGGGGERKKAKGNAGELADARIRRTTLIRCLYLIDVGTCKKRKNRKSSK